LHYFFEFVILYTWKYLGLLTLSPIITECPQNISRRLYHKGGNWETDSMFIGKFE